MFHYGVIMAGGDGTRFWPLSRQSLPKQFLNLTGNDLLINETIDRLGLIIDKNYIYTVANQTHTATILNSTNGRIIPKHIISEPVSRNTLACIAYAAISIYTEYGDGVIVATPSDAYIKDNAEFSKTLKTAIEYAENNDKIVTIGITPSFPATGYGYIKYENTGNTVKSVLKFSEKPDMETAVKYLNDNYYWNSGIYIVKISVLFEKIKKYASDVYKMIEEIGICVIRNNYEIINEMYPQIRKISFDYAIAEPASVNNEIAVVNGNFGWSDVGTWDMLSSIYSPDKNGNVIVGNSLNIDTFDSVIFSNEKLTATVGIDNLIIVDADDALLVCKKDSCQKVKMIVEKLKEQGKTELI